MRALAVGPADLGAARGRGGRAHQAVDPLGHEQLLVHPRVLGPRDLPALDAVGGLARDDGGEAVGVAVGELEADLAAHRAAERDRALEAERVGARRRSPRRSGRWSAATRPRAGRLGGVLRPWAGRSNAVIRHCARSSGSASRWWYWRPSEPAVWRNSRSRPAPACSAEQLRGAGRQLDAHVAAGDRREVGGRAVAAAPSAAAPGRPSSSRRAIACACWASASRLPSTRELRHLRQQREQRLVARRRHVGPQPVPHRGGRAEAEVDAAVEAVVERVGDRRAVAQVDPHDVVAAAQGERDVGARADRPQAPVARGAREPGLDELRPVGHEASQSVAIEA